MKKNLMDRARLIRYKSNIKEVSCFNETSVHSASGTSID